MAWIRQPFLHLKRINDWIYAILIFTFIFALYLWSAPATVVFEDDGFFLLSAYFNGISHPPGYPVYTLLAHLATQFPGSTVAFRVHALSALFGALTCVCIYLIAEHVIKNRAAAAVAGAGFGLSEVFWSQSIIAEVYSLNALLLFLLVLLCMKLSVAEPGRKSVLLRIIALIFGLGLANHWPLFILSCPLLAGVLWPFNKIKIAGLVKAVPFFLAGLSPYLWMVVRSQMDPVISFYGPVDSFYKFWFIVSRAGYSAVDTSPTANWIDKYDFIVYFFRQFALQFGLAGFLFVIIGFIRQWRSWSRPVAIGCCVAVLCNSLVLITLLGFDFDVVHKNLFRVYPHIAYGIASIWLALGFYFVVNFLSASKYLSVNRRTISLVLATLVLGIELMANLPLNYRAMDTWSEKYGLAILNNLDKNAVLFTSGEWTTGPVGYLHMIEGIRSDVTLYNGNGLVFSNRLYSFNASDEIKRLINDNFIQQSDRPIYFMGKLESSYGNYFLGPFLKINRALKEKSTLHQINGKIVDDVLKLISSPVPQDPAQNFMYQLLTLDYCRLSASFILPTIETGKLDESRIEPYCRTYQGYLKLMEVLLEMENPDMNMLDFLIKHAVTLQYQSMSKQDSAMVDYYRGVYYSKTGDKEVARQFFHAAISVWSHSENPAVQAFQETRP